MALYAFDGTWDDSNSKTNVWSFYSAYQKNEPSKFNTYFTGVGTKVSMLGHLAGGIFGAGEKTIVNEAVACLEGAYKAGDTIIDVVGFSRGAAAALDFANRVHALGYRIRFIGLWDTVAAFGIANLGFAFSKLTFGHKLTLPLDKIDYCYHAMALDERRPNFVVTRVKNAHEVWFRGCHTDIGGGGQSHELSDIALRWMFYKASASGLPILEADIRALKPNPDAPIGPTFFSRISKFTRAINREDFVHYTVSARRDCVNPQMPIQPAYLEGTGSEQFPNPVPYEVAA